MKLKLSSLAALSLIAFGCHAPVHRAPKSPTDPNAASAKQKSAPCDVQGTLITAIKTKHPDATNLLVGQMFPVLVANSPTAHPVATFNASPSSATAAPGASPVPSPVPSTDPSGSTTVQVGAIADDAPPAPGASPAPSPNPGSQSTVASGFIDPVSCAIVGYLETPVVSDISHSIDSCEDPEKAMGTDGETKAFALIKYDDSFKSPYEAEHKTSLSEVYSLGADDSGAKTVTKYLFDQSTCQPSDYPDKATVTDPNAVKPKKSGS